MSSLTTNIQAFWQSHYRLIFLYTLILLHLAWTFQFAPHNHLNDEELFTHLTAKNLVENTSLYFHNGYTDFEEPGAKFHPDIVETEQGLFIPSSSVFAVIAAPFYAFSGFTGLFFLNALAFLVTLYAIYRITLTTFSDNTMAHNSCLLYILTTAAWQYSQSAAVGTLAISLAALAILLCISANNTKTKPMTKSFVAGILIGISAEIQTDILLTAPILLIYLVLAEEERIKKINGLVFGIITSLLALAVTHSATLGVLSPFTFERPFIESFSNVPDLAYVWNNIYAVLVDSFAFYGTTILSLFTQSHDLSDVIAQGQFAKRALLQMLPFFVVLIYPIWQLVRGQEKWRELLVYICIPLLYIAYYSVMTDTLETPSIYGFFGIFPLIAILVAYSWKHLTKDVAFSPVIWGNLIFIVAILSGVYLIEFRTQPTLLVTFTHLLPLLLASLVLLGTLASLFLSQVCWVQRLLTRVLFITLVWSAATAFTNDYGYALEKRQDNARYTSVIEPIKPHSTVFIWGSHPSYFPLFDIAGIKVINIHLDGQAEDIAYRDILRKVLDANRNVYFLLQPWMKKKLGQEDEITFTDIASTSDITLYQADLRHLLSQKAWEELLEKQQELAEGSIESINTQALAILSSLPEGSVLVTNTFLIPLNSPVRDLENLRIITKENAPDRVMQEAHNTDFLEQVERFRKEEKPLFVIMNQQDWNQFFADQEFTTLIPGKNHGYPPLLGKL